MLKINISGVDQTIAEFSALDLNAVKNVDAEIEASAKRIKDTASANAPADSGQLKRKIYIRRNKKEGSATVTYMGKLKAFWGVFVEFGTRFQAAQPFLGPAGSQEAPIFERNIKKALEEADK